MNKQFLFVLFSMFALSNAMESSIIEGASYFVSKVKNFSYARLGEIPHQEVVLKEIFNALEPGGILSITELIFDPHFQRKSSVLRLTHSIGFKEEKSFGSWWAYTLHLEKPVTY